MVLARDEIYKLIEKKSLVVDPLYADTVRENGLDLRIGGEYAIYAYEGAIVRPCSLEDARPLFRIVKAEEVVIPPRNFVLLTTEEYIKMPDDVVGLATLRSTLARYGLVIPPCVHKDEYVIDVDGVPRRAEEAVGVYDPLARSFSVKKVVHRDAPLVRVYTELSTEPFVVTPNHKFMSFDPVVGIVEKRADQLNVGDFVAVVRFVDIAGDAQYTDLHPNHFIKVDEKLAQVIEDRRRELGLTHKKLGVEIGSSKNYTLYVVKRKWGVRYGKLSKVLNILGIERSFAVRHMHVALTRKYVPASVFIRKVDRDVGYLVGYYTGDGYTIREGKKHRALVFEKNEYLVEHLVKLLEKLFKVSVAVRKYGRKHIIDIPNAVRLWLLRNFPEGVGEYQPSRRVPALIARSGRDAVAGFIAGLFDAEGYSDGTQDYISTSSRDLAYGVRLLMLRLGIVAYLERKKCVKHCNYDAWYVYPPGAFARQLFRSAVKPVKSLAPVPKKEVVDLIPITELIAKSLAELPGKRGLIENYVRRRRIPVNRLGEVLNALRTHRPKHWVEAVEQLLALSRYRWAKVTGVENGGKDVVVDWETPSHWHLTDIYITHNTVVDAGFEGNITIEVVNESPNTIVLKRGLRFLHLILVRAEGSAKYSGTYQGQRGVTPPKGLKRECI